MPRYKISRVKARVYTTQKVPYYSLVIPKIVENIMPYSPDTEFDVYVDTDEHCIIYKMVPEGGE